jgi:hypothetical protein
MFQVRIASRRGNVVLAALGAVYAVGALVVLVLFIADVGTAMAALDLLLQLGLIGSLVCGLWFLANGLKNLGIDWTHPASR